MAERTILVVGGSGFVGRYVVDRLVAAGDRVVVPTRTRDKARHLFVLPTVSVVAADVNRAGELPRLARGASAVTEKEAGHLINRPGFIQPRRAMAAIGG